MTGVRGIPLVGDLVTATGTVRTVEDLPGTGRIRVTLDTLVETEGVEIHPDRPGEGVGMYRAPGAVLPQHVTMPYDFLIEESGDVYQRRAEAPPIPPVPAKYLRVETDPPVSYFTPAAADPAVRRFPHPVTVTAEELGQKPLDQVKREGGSPVRTYLLRHLDEAQIALGYAETALEDAKSDHETRAGQVAMILEALGHLDDLEAVAVHRPDYSEGDPHR